MSGSALRWVDRLAVTVSRSERAVLRDHANRANTFWASWAATPGIAKRTQYAERTVENCERSLVKKRLLIPVPWVTNYGRETSSGYFLAGVFDEFDELPDVEIAFKERIEFRDRRTGAVCGGRPRGFTPGWWSGRRRNTEGSQDETPQSALRGPKNGALRGPTHGTPITTIGNHHEVHSAATADAGQRALTASAVSKMADDADASSGAATASPRKGERSTAKPRTARRTLADRVDEHLVALGIDCVDSIFRDLENDRGIMPWAIRKAAAALRLPFGSHPDDDPGGPLARKAVGIALMALSKQDGGITGNAEAEFGAFAWPANRHPGRRSGARKPDVRRSLPHVTYYEPTPGTSDKEVLDGLYGEIRALPDEQAIAKGEQFRLYRPEVHDTCAKQARERLADLGRTATSVDVVRMTLMYGVLKYSGRWPMFVDPAAPASQ